MQVSMVVEAAIHLCSAANIEATWPNAVAQLNLFAQRDPSLTVSKLWLSIRGANIYVVRAAFDKRLTTKSKGLNNT